MSVVNIAKCKKQMTPRGRLIELFAVYGTRSQISALIISDLYRNFLNQQLSQKMMSRNILLEYALFCQIVTDQEII